MKYIFLISGKLRSGKNQFAEYLQQELLNRRISVGTDLYASALKEGCKEDFKLVQSFLDSYAEGIKAMVRLFEDVGRNPQREAFLEAIEKKIDEVKFTDANWYENKTTLTRLILQIYGTEIFRRRVDDNWWAEQLRKRVIQSTNQSVIVTDTRFPNEISVFTDNPIQDTEVYTVRIERKFDTPANIAQHESEVALDNYDCWNYVVDNNGTLEDLKASAKSIVSDIFDETDEVIGLFTRVSIPNMKFLVEHNLRVVTL